MSAGSASPAERPSVAVPPTEATDGPRLSMVVPAYRSSAYIAVTVDRLQAAFRELGLSGEVIVVDDGSDDGTVEAVPLAAGVRAIRLPVNSGKGAALRAGMAVATGSIRGFTDADLPYGTEPLRFAIDCIERRGFHAAIGDRTLPGSAYAGAGVVRTVVSEIASFAFRTLVTGGIYDTQCGFKLFRGDVAAGLFDIARVDRFAVDVELIYLLLKYRLDIKRVPVRLEGNASSSVSVFRDSATAALDILRMRIRWARGRYRSDALVACLAKDLGLEREAGQLARIP